MKMTLKQYQAYAKRIRKAVDATTEAFDEVVAYLEDALDQLDPSVEP